MDLSEFDVWYSQKDKGGDSREPTTTHTDESLENPAPSAKGVNASICLHGHSCTP